MKKSVLLAFTIMLAISALRAVDIVKDGKSNYSICFSGKRFEPAANLLQKCISDATGCRLPVVENSSGPAIRIGQTPKGIDTIGMNIYEHHIKEQGRDVYLYGFDGRVCDSKGIFVASSNKAVTAFCEKFLNTVFAFPGPEGVITPSLKVLSVPENFHYGQVPAISECRSRNDEIFYDLANNFYPPSWFGSDYGHSHPKAIPFGKYFKTHPEYFAMVDGKRYTWRPQYCISHPEVQELIYQEVVRHLDQGFTTAELSQSDSFKPCECENCVKLYDTDDYSEKLWILHRNIAEKVLEARPGKKVCIIAYGPTIMPPKSFSKFPENVMIELAPCSETSFSAWEGRPVPQGFYTYLYNWGNYKLEGFTPRMPLKAIADQTRLFRRAGINGIYRCGFGELWGLEGPAYYIWGKMLENPDADPQLLLKKYCDYTFDAGAKDMLDFYQLLDEALTSVPSERDINWDSFIEDDGSRANFSMLQRRYTSQRLEKLESLLEAAEKKSASPAAKFLLPVVRVEFDNLKLTVEIIRLFEIFLAKQDRESFRAVAEKVAARRTLINSLPQETTKDGNKVMGKKGYLKYFGGEKVSQVLEGGRLRGPLFTPFTWDTQWMLKENIMPVFRTLGYGEKSQLVQGYNFEQNPDVIAFPVFVSCTKDAQNLYVDFELPNDDVSDIIAGGYQVVIGRGQKYFRIYNRNKNRNDPAGIKSAFGQVCPRIKTNSENDGNGDYYQVDNSMPSLKITYPVPGKNDKTVRFSVPWDLTGGPLSRDEAIDFNAVYTCAKKKVRYIWNHNVFQRRWKNYCDLSGKLKE